MFNAIPENIPYHPAILAAGKRRTGKSTSLDNLMCATMQGIPFGMVMTETSVNGFWQRRVPPKFVFQGLREDIMVSLIQRQKRMMAKYGNDDPRVRAFIIFDDVIADQVAIRWSKNINTFFVEGRHHKVTVLITTQNMKGIGPMVRGNMDIIIAQPIYNLAERDAMHSLFAGFLPKKTFMQLMDEVVVSEPLPGDTPQTPKLKVRVLVVEDWKQTNDCQRKFSWWSPVHSDELPEYKLCDKRYWKERPEDMITTGGGHSGKVARNVVDTLDEVSRMFK